MRNIGRSLARRRTICVLRCNPFDNAEAVCPACPPASVGSNSHRVAPSRLYHFVYLGRHRYLPSDEEIRAEMPVGGGSAYDFGFIMGMPRVRAAHRRISPLFGPLFREIMFGPGELSRAEREMVAAVTAAAQDCLY